MTESFEQGTNMPKIEDDFYCSMITRLNDYADRLRDGRRDPEIAQALEDAACLLEEAERNVRSMIEPTPENMAAVCRWLEEIHGAETGVQTEIDLPEVETLLQQAFYKVKHPMANANGGPIQLGGVYWRLVAVLNGYVVPKLEVIEGYATAQRLRSIHRYDPANPRINAGQPNRGKA